MFCPVREHERGVFAGRRTCKSQVKKSVKWASGNCTDLWKCSNHAPRHKDVKGSILIAFDKLQAYYTRAYFRLI